ncbi:uncharacterized protein LOC128605161 isoform X2 [Ictalurus furcatus]|uniref:uncharacterized protein LOC128605161 isoform X2 n=1 Tax=Ictalurus furcatus TaxID=66913 RepID=UPI0023507588|nr:uncharacterized protein LOC128605161 isoform X2 [Ictalurus furcatus]XP_053476308.1 uncharacterized protein LOC128605161 isoform X2 [Ictalurus furcatus]
MHFSVCLVFAFAVGHEGLHVHGREHLQVMGADQAVFAYKGEEVILNCSLDGQVPASKIEEVSWKRTDGDQNVLVLLYQNNVTIPESSHESYWDRVELFSSEISKGNFSLKLMDVQMEDKGEFICEVHAMNTSARTTVVLAGVAISELICVLAPPAMVMMMVLSLQRHVFEGKPFGVEIALSSLIVTIYSLGVISIFILFARTFKGFVKRGWMILFEGVMFIFAWLVLICLLRCYQRPRQERSSHCRKKGYLFCGVVVAFLITVHGIVYFSCIYIMTEHKERAGYLALTPLIHVLAATCLFKHPKRLPGYFHIMVYMFGAVGLSAVNAIALTTELILKAGNGARTIGDLRVIVLSLETVFISAWLALQIYNAWMRLRDRRF